VLDRYCLFAGLAAFDAENSEGAEAGGQLRGGDDARFAGLPGLFFAWHWKLRL
jgi:hypothetical protein